VDTRFDIEFSGETAVGHDPAAVQSAVGQLFRADAATLLRLFSGARLRIKRDCDAQTAQRYLQALARVGAIARIVPAAGPGDTPPNAVETLSLAPVGAPIPGLPRASGKTPDTSHLTLAEAGEPIPTLPTLREALDPPTDHLELAPPGPIAAMKPPAPAAQAPSYDLAPAGSRLVDPAPTPPPADASPDWDLAAPGARLTEPLDRTPPTIANTDHLKLVDD